MRQHVLSDRLHAAGDVAIAAIAGLIAVVVFYPLYLAAQAVAPARPRERRRLSPQNF